MTVWKRSITVGDLVVFDLHHRPRDRKKRLPLWDNVNIDDGHQILGEFVHVTDRDFMTVIWVSNERHPLCEPSEDTRKTLVLTSKGNMGFTWSAFLSQL